MNQPDFSYPDGLPVSQVVSNMQTLRLGAGNVYSATALALAEGVELVQWKGFFPEAQEIALHDDSDRVHFSFTCGMDGQAACRLQEHSGAREYLIRAGSGNISHGTGRKGHYCQAGYLENITVMMHRDLLAKWAVQSDTDLRALLRRGSFLQGYDGMELQVMARQLNASLHTGASMARTKNRLWLYGQSMALVALFLDDDESHSTRTTKAPDEARIRRARDFLLQDLSHPATLAELAEETGLSVASISRGFRRQFGLSVYALFQQERMHAAREQLLRDGVSVSRVAADFGYTNTSHFSAAFNKQFGINPGMLKKPMHG